MSRELAGVGKVLLCLGLALASPAAAADPVADLAADLSQKLSRVVDEGSAIAVPPTVDRRGDLGRHTARLRKLLLLQLASLEEVRILAVDHVPLKGLVLSTDLDTLERSFVLSATLAEAGAGGLATVPLITTAPAGELLDSNRPENRNFGFSIITAGEVPGPVRASSAGDVTADRGDELVLLSDEATHVLHLRSSGFQLRSSRPHPAPEADSAGGEEGTQASPLPVSRDPRGGAVVLAPGRIWIRVPGSSVAAIVGPRVTGGMRRARVDWTPLGRTGGGRILVGELASSSNLFTRVGTVSGPDDREPLFEEALSPALEVAVGAGWVVIGSPQGETVAYNGPERERIGELGDFGTALAILDLGLGSRPLLLGDHPGSGVLRAVGLATGFGRELWQGAAPFVPCLLEAGDFDGNGRAELALVGCGDPAPIALLVPEGRP